MRRPSLRNILVLLSLSGLAVGGAWGRWRATAPAEGGQYNHEDNGLWMRRHWIHGGATQTPDQLAEELRALGIRRIYPFLGPMDAEGWPGWRDQGQIRRYDPETAGAFFTALRAAAPELQILPWSGGVLDRDVHLEDSAQRAAFADHAARLVALGADGVQLNVEPMPSDTPGYLALLRAVKAAIGPEATLSVAAYPPTTPLHPFPEVHWSLDFTRAVCLEADELAVMAYDTALASSDLYEGLVAHWTRQLLDTLPPPEDGGCELLLGVPAYEDDEPWHRPDAETLEAGLRGVLRGLGRGPVPAHFRGVAIYASWTTDAEEWAHYDRLWRGRAQGSGAVVQEAP